jgi:hypothetical protein
MAYMSEVRNHIARMIVLVERWHNKTSSFHLLAGEAIVTLEDIWRILRLPIHGEWVFYGIVARVDAFYDLLEHEDLILSSLQIDIEMYRGHASTLRLVVAALIMGVVAPNR